MKDTQYILNYFKILHKVYRIHLIYMVLNIKITRNIFKLHFH